MKYQGSKNRIAKEILPIMLAERTKNQAWVEPFVGGANLIDKVDGWRIGADNNKYLIAFFDAVSKGWLPPETITESAYHNIKKNKDALPELTGYAGFALSYGGKWFGGWCRDKAGKRDYVGEAYRNLLKQRPNIVGVQWVHTSYIDITIPANSIVYCDPPYKGTTGYHSSFNHDTFWHWVKRQYDDGNTVYVSEYDAPDFMECVWQKEITSSLTQDTGSKKAVEKLYRIG